MASTPNQSRIAANHETETSPDKKKSMVLERRRREALRHYRDAKSGQLGLGERVRAACVDLRNPSDHPVLEREDS